MEKMTLRIFNAGMGRLEQIFNRGISLKKSVRTEYFTAVHYEKPRIFEDAIQLVIETFKPFPSEPFPSVATIKIATLRVVDETEGEAGHREEGAQRKDRQELNFCDRCGNSGFYLGHQGEAQFCDCEKGRLRQAAWGIGTGDRKRQEKIQRALDCLPPSSGPVHGLRERNPTGFWELTKDEHEKWMTAKRVEIAEMDARRAEARRRDKEEGRAEKDRPGHGKELQDAMKEALATIGEAKRAMREPGDGPFERREQLTEGGIT